MQELSALEDTRLIMNLAEMITEVDVEKQSAKIASCLKGHFPVQGIVLSIQVPNTRKAYLHAESVPGDISKQIQEFCEKLGHQGGPRDEIMAFSLKEGKMLSVNLQRPPKPEEPTVFAVPLIAGNTVFGTLALVTDSAAISSLTSGKSALPFFAPP